MKASLCVLALMLATTALHASEEGVYKGRAVHPFLQWERPVRRFGLGRPLGHPRASLSKLDRLMVSALNLHDATFSEAVELLRQAGADADIPNHEGVVLDTTRIPLAADTLVTLLAGSSMSGLLNMLSPTTTTPHITSSFQNVPLKIIAYSIAASAHYRIIEDKGAIIFVPR